MLPIMPGFIETSESVGGDKSVKIPPGYRVTPLAPASLPAPVEIEFTFIDGPFDGHKSTATVGAVLSDRFTVWMKKDGERFSYRYAGDNKFKYEGIQEECPAPSLLETDPA